MGIHERAQEVLACAYNNRSITTWHTDRVSTGLSCSSIYLYSFLKFKMKNILLLVASIVFAELVLQGICFLSPAVDSIVFGSLEPIAFKRGLLGYEGNPKRFDHDARGYRNEIALERADIVMLGDSHTYGASVDITEAWPYLIQKKSGIKTYNMGLGGYGPAHNLLQLDKAIELSPKLVIMGIYFGNDFFDNFKLAINNDQIATFLTNDEMEIIKKLENSSNLEEKVSHIFNMVIAKSNRDKSSQSTKGLRKLISQNSALYGLARAFKNEMHKRVFVRPTILSKDYENAEASLTSEQLDFCSAFHGEEGWRTILTSPYRGLVNDRKDPRIDIGFDLTGRVLIEIKNRIASSGAELLVVLLPTKESVFSRKILNPKSHIGYSDLISNEQVNRDELKQFLGDNRIPFLDLLPYLQNSKKQPYFSNADGHPNELGHEIITDAIVEQTHNFR